MSSPARTATPETEAVDAAALCHEEGIGSVVVVEDEEPVGIVTNGDFVRVLGTETDPERRPLRELMSAPVETTGVDVPVEDAVETMFENDIAHLVVLDDGDLVGVVSTDDVIRHVPQVFHRSKLATPDGTDHRYRVRPETAYEDADWEFESVSHSDEGVSVGDRVEFSKTISERDVRSFAAATGDTNRLHLDDDYAAGTRFGRRIVHGTLVGGLVSAALARLPGLTIYLSQDLSFHSPVDVGERATAVCEVVEAVSEEKYALTTDVYGEDDEEVIEGEAVVLVDPLPDAARVDSEALT